MRTLIKLQSLQFIIRFFDIVLVKNATINQPSEIISH